MVGQLCISTSSYRQVSYMLGNDTHDSYMHIHVIDMKFDTIFFLTIAMYSLQPLYV